MYPNLQEPDKNEMREFNKRVIEETRQDHERFLKAFKRGVCDFCGQNLDFSDKDKPCFHWLLRPNGVDKKEIRKVLESIDFFRIRPYLRWVANSEVMFKNINDLESERRPYQIIEETIKYKNLEWSFQCSKNCFSGRAHISSFWFKKPHYHFQMKIDDKLFISYRDFHIPFTDYDLFSFDVKNGKIPLVKHVEMWDAGMEFGLNNLDPAELLNTLKTTADESKDVFHLNTFLTSDSGEGISGDVIADLIKKRELTGVTFAKLAQNLKGVRVQTIISPGERVPEIAKRKDKKRKKHTKQV